MPFTALQHIDDLFSLHSRGGVTGLVMPFTALQLQRRRNHDFRMPAWVTGLVMPFTALQLPHSDNLLYQANM